MTREKSLFSCLMLLAAGLFPASATAGSMHVGHPHVAAQKRWGTQAAHVKFYNKMMAKFNRNPKAFTRRHQLMAKAIRNPRFNQEMVRRLMNHPNRFIANHPCFARFLDGQTHDEVPAQADVNPPNLEVVATTLGTAGQDLHMGGGITPTIPSLIPGPPVPGPPVPNAAVPEPSSILLVGTALLVGGFLRRRIHHARHGSPTPPEPTTAGILR